jgi:ferritin
MKPEVLPKEIVDLLLPRLSDEFKAYYFYRAAANWCKGVGFMKAGAFFHNESDDELEHAKKIEDFFVDWNVDPDLPVIAKPQIKFKSLMEVIEKAYEMEYKLYEAYEETSVRVFKTNDLCTFDMLQFFRGIQTKSVAEYSDMLNILDGVSCNKFEMLQLEETLFGDEAEG